MTSTQRRWHTGERKKNTACVSDCDPGKRQRSSSSSSLADRHLGPEWDSDHDDDEEEEDRGKRERQ